jgi:hypothetical protein
MSLLLLLQSTSPILQSDSQHSIPLLCIPNPQVVLTASLSALPTATNNSVVDLPISVVSGDIGDVLADMTCLIMNGAETEVTGVVRIRKAPIAGHLYISEDNLADNTASERRWVVGCHLLVLEETIGIWPKAVRVVDEDTFYVDWEIAYTNQHAHPAPLIRLGPPVIPVLWEAGEEIEITIDASDSVVPYSADTISSWSWSQSGGAGIAGETTNSPVVTVNGTGRVVVTGTATTSAGKTATRQAYIEVYDKRATDRPPTTLFELISSPQGSTESGGWKFGVKLYGQASKTQIRDRAVVCLFSRDWYSNIEASFGPIAGREHIVAWGWIAGETIEWDSDGGFVTFEVEGPPYWCERARGFTFGLLDTDFAGSGGGAPNNLGEMEDLTVDKAIAVLAQEYSTLSKACDVFLTGDTRQAAMIQSGERDLWGQLMDVCYRTILAQPIFDRYGRLHVQKNQQHVPLDERDTIPVVMDLTSDDHVKVVFTRRIMPRYSQVTISGVYWSSGQFALVGAYSPGKVPVLGDEPFDESDLVIGAQSMALEWAGLIAGSGDGEIAGATVEIPRNNRYFDIAPHMWVRTDLAAADTERGVAIAELRLIPRLVRLDWDDEGGAWVVSLETEAEGIQWGAVKMTFPTEGEPPIESPPEPPELPPEPPDGPPEEPPEPSDVDAVAATISDIRTAADLDQASPTWTTEL